MADSTERLLGQLIESVAGLRRDITDLRGDFDQEKDHAHESRRDVHQKIDALTGRVAQVEGTVQISGQVTAQTRDKIAAMEPTVDEFKRIKLMGHGVIWAVGIAGGALGLTASSWVAPTNPLAERSVGHPMTERPTGVPGICPKCGQPGNDMGSKAGHHMACCHPVSLPASDKPG